MFKLFPILFLILYNLDQDYVASQGYFGRPGEIKWYGWAQTLSNIHLTNMTKELLKDMTAKLQHAKTVQDDYRLGMSYELGTLAASVQDLFLHMLAVYRTYTNMTVYVNKDHTFHQVLDAYHVIQGDYNKIRMERDFFYKAQERHELAREERRKKLREMQKLGSSPDMEGRHPFEDKLLEMMDKNTGRRAFSYEDSADTNDDGNVQEEASPPQMQLRRSKNTKTALPQMATRRETVKKKLWTPRAERFAEDTKLE